MRRTLAIVAGLLAVQALLAALFIAGHRDGESVKVERVSWQAPGLAFRTRAGDLGRLRDFRGRPVLLHFWASWCPPCRDELPSLLAWAAESDIDILAVSLDGDWEAVETFLRHPAPGAVVLAASTKSAHAFATRTLPESLLVDARGRVVLRFAGPRDWSSPAVRELVHREAVAGAASRGRELSEGPPAP